MQPRLSAARRSARPLPGGPLSLSPTAHPRLARPQRLGEEHVSTMRATEAVMALRQLSRD